MAAPDHDSASRLFVVGVNQRSASAMLCERLFAEEIEPSALLARLRAAGDAGAVAEAVVLSTCERLEVMAVADAPAAGAQALVGLLAEETGTPPWPSIRSRSPPRRSWSHATCTARSNGAASSSPASARWASSWPPS